MTPKTNAGKALVEWAQNAAPNQIDVWREHAVLIESEAYELGIRMVKPDVEAQQAIYTAEQVTHAYQQGRNDALRTAVATFLKRWDSPEVYHRLPAVDDLRAALAEPDA